MIGEVIGNFRLTKRLGRGGMGEVFLAEHKEQGTQVAIKLLNGDISDNHEQVQRFFNEARVVSKIRHAGTVKIFDSGFAGDRAYLIMELLEGESLAKRLERGPLDEATAIATAQQIASILDATHRQGIIHRDLKPDNIYLVLDDERGERVKILDFGIAKLSGTMAAVSPKTSGTMGTPAYMSPEQWSDSSAVDWRADAYALGCVMFEMVCGRPPFIATTIPEAYTKHVLTPAPRASTLAPHPIGKPLDDLIARLLAKEPSERAVAMEQIVRELAELGGIPVPVVPRASSPISLPPADTATPRTPSATTLGASASSIALDAPKPAARGKWFAALGAVAAIAAVVVVAVAMAGKRADDPKPAAVAPPPPPPSLVTVALDAPPPPPPLDAAIDAPPPPPPIDAPAAKPHLVVKPRPDAAPTDEGGWGGRL